MTILPSVRSIKASGLVRATFTVASLGLLMKIFGMAKDMLVASRFGVGREMDIYTLAFSIASFPLGLLAGNLREAFIPVYVGLRSQGAYSEAWHLHHAVRRRLVMGMALLGLLIALTVPLWSPLMVPTWSVADRARLHWVLIVLLVTLPQGGAVLFIGSVLQGQNRFTPPALTPVLPTMAVIAGLLVLPHSWGAFQLGTGLVLGGVLEMSVLLWILRRFDPMPGENERVNPAESLRVVGHLYLPAIGAGLFMATTPLVDMVIAAWLPPGAISTLAYANKIPAVVILISGALGTTISPTFSHLAGLGQWTKLRAKATQAFVLVLGATLLMTPVLCLASPFLVKILFHRGSFGMDQVRLVSSVQTIYFLQIPLFVPSILSVRLIQALRQQRIILYGTILSAGLNLGLDLAFLPILGARGIALSTVFVYLGALIFLTTWAHRLLKERENESPRPLSIPL